MSCWRALDPLGTGWIWLVVSASVTLATFGSPEQKPGAQPTSVTGSEETPDAQAQVRAFYDRARKIIEQNQNLELSLDEARRRVNRLHEDIEAWSETHDVELIERSESYNHNPNTESEPASTELCPLFFAEELDELCPLDQTRSEVWGARTVLCRYECLK